MVTCPPRPGGTADVLQVVEADHSHLHELIGADNRNNLLCSLQQLEAEINAQGNHYSPVEVHIVDLLIDA